MPKQCEFENCKLRAVYGVNNEMTFCKEHKLDNMKYYDKRKCMICNKTRPYFNYPNEKIGLYCGDCKLDGMIDIKNKKCDTCNKKQPLFNYPDEKIGLYCGDCKKDGMIDIKHKKCDTCNKKIPNFNYPDEKTPLYCGDCKKDGMIDIINKKCNNCNKKQPYFNYPNEETALYCGDCKKDGMIDIKNKKCDTCNKKHPVFNYPDEKTALYCGDCKKDGMIDIKHKKCKANDETLCDTQGSIKYKGYCSRCYQYLFPEDPLSYQIRSKTKEIAVRDYINDNFKGFTHDKPLYTAHCDCSIRRRIDHRILIGNTLLCVETDENQHKSYDKKDEEIRYDDLYNAYSGKWIYIRFNPDKYKINGKTKNPNIATRLTELKKEIDKQIKRINNEENTELLEIIKMFYDV